MTIYAQEDSFGAPDVDESEEVDCKRCHGSGEDEDGADCLSCYGYGTVILSE